LYTVLVSFLFAGSFTYDRFPRLPHPKGTSTPSSEPTSSFSVLFSMGCTPSFSKDR
jgi:hypothetical protein